MADIPAPEGRVVAIGSQGFTDLKWCVCVRVCVAALQFLKNQQREPIETSTTLLLLGTEPLSPLSKVQIIRPPGQVLQVEGELVIYLFFFKL